MCGKKLRPQRERIGRNQILVCARTLYKVLGVCKTLRPQWERIRRDQSLVCGKKLRSQWEHIECDHAFHNELRTKYYERMRRAGNSQDVIKCLIGNVVGSVGRRNAERRTQ